MRICLIEPYDTGSHSAWLRGYAAHSAYEVTTLTLEGRFWKWRMQGGALALARHYRELSCRPDLLLATDMLDLGAFLAITRDLTHELPVALYMHENQLTYPLRPDEKRELQYAWTNYASMCCADAILFNSQYHLDAWYEELPRLLKHYPDHNELGNVSLLRARSQVLPLGLDLAGLDAHRPPSAWLGAPIVLWNHRWEYDKDPGTFCRALNVLLDQGLDLRLVLLGEHFVSTPPEFATLRARLGERLLQFGYAESRAAYARWLWDADIVVSTAIHEFFGASVAEAMYCGCFPVLPNRLSYPQFVPAALRSACLYDTEPQLIALLAQAIRDIDTTRAASLRPYVARYDWASLAPAYDRALAEILPSVLSA